MSRFPKRPVFAMAAAALFATLHTSSVLAETPEAFMARVCELGPSPWVGFISTGGAGAVGCHWRFPYKEEGEESLKGGVSRIPDKAALQESYAIVRAGLQVGVDAGEGTAKLEPYTPCGSDGVVFVSAGSAAAGHPPVRWIVFVCGDAMVQVVAQCDAAVEVADTIAAGLQPMAAEAPLP